LWMKGMGSEKALIGGKGQLSNVDLPETSKENRVCAEGSWKNNSERGGVVDLVWRDWGRRLWRTSTVSCKEKRKIKVRLDRKEADKGNSERKRGVWRVYLIKPNEEGYKRTKIA